MNKLKVKESTIMKKLSFVVALSVIAACGSAVANQGYQTCTNHKSKKLGCITTQQLVEAQKAGYDITCEGSANYGDNKDLCDTVAKAGAFFQGKTYVIDYDDLIQ